MFKTKLLNIKFWATLFLRGPPKKRVSLLLWGASSISIVIMRSARAVTPVLWRWCLYLWAIGVMGFRVVTIVNLISNVDDWTQKKFSSKQKMILIEILIGSYKKKKFCTSFTIVILISESEAPRVVHLIDTCLQTWLKLNEVLKKIPFRTRFLYSEFLVFIFFYSLLFFL